MHWTVQGCMGGCMGGGDVVMWGGGGYKTIKLNNFRLVLRKSQPMDSRVDMC